VSKRVTMKIIEEPSSYGLNSYNDQQPAPDILRMRVPPSNFSGPPHLRALYGHCFSKIDNEYKYEFCPFSNVTQHEQSIRWNPYSGILGVWQDWQIQNNTFTGMMMREGDSCGSISRTVKILLVCGHGNVVTRVSEPETCQYEVLFETPYVCHPHAMLVYPVLEEQYRKQWDMLESRYRNAELTQQGYNKKLAGIFELAGLQLPLSVRSSLSERAKHTENTLEAHAQGEFTSLDTCKQEYKKLKDELEGMKALLAVYQSGNNTHGTS